MNKYIIFGFILFIFGCNNKSKNALIDNMELIPGGEFMIGSDSATASYIAKKYPTDCDISWFSNQFPQHKVKIDTFFIDKYEVTYGEFKNFIKSTNYKPMGNWEEYYKILLDTVKMKKTFSKNDYNVLLKSIKKIDKFPVVGVTWEDALQYCRWRGKRLPTEAEWEYVAKGKEKNLIYPWGMEYDSTKANVQNKIGPKPVGSYFPYSYNVYDLGGNAQEWCSDYYDENYYQLKEYDNPSGPKVGKQRVVRGGSWALNGPFYAQSSTRTTIKIGSNYQNLVGFRCACSLDDKKN